MSLLQKLKKLKAVSKPKLVLFGIGALAVIVALCITINMLSIALSEVKGFEGYPEGKASANVSGKLKEDERAPEGMSLVAEDSGAALFFDSTTAKMAILDKESGNYWYSNPVNSADDAIATGANKAKLESQIIINYYDDFGKSGSFNSNEACIQQENLSYELIENGIKVIYTMGDDTVTREMLPAVVSKKKFEDKILDKLSEEQADELLEYYELTSVEESSKSAAKKYTELYSDIDTSDKYYFLDLYTPDYKLDEIYNLIFSISGYTVGEVEEDNDNIGYNIDVQTFKQFTVPVEITLSEGDMVASIPAADIISPAGLNLTEITLLPFFGAASSEENGYIFVPDGSGAVIDFNSGDANSAGYVLPIYGQEPAKDKKQADFIELSANIPVFGMAFENKAGMLAIVESGDSHTSVAAQISGIVTSYNQVYPIFELLPKDSMEVESNSSVLVTNLYQEKPYDGYYTVRYKFTDKAHADYSSLAVLYRDYLTENGTLSKNEITRKFIVRLTGKVEVEESLFGIPYKNEKVLTSFSQAEKIVSELKASGVDNIDVGFMSWFGGGTAHDAVNGKLKPAYGMGGKKGLIALSEEIGDSGKLSLGADLIKIYKGFPQFNSFSYAVRRLTNNIKTVDFYNPATYMPDESKGSYYLLSPEYFESVLKDFDKSAKSLGTESIWLNDSGNLLTSDFRNGDMIDRENAKYMITEALSYACEDTHITFNDPNLYVLKYCDTAVCLPYESSGSNLLSYSVPFLEIVLSGRMNYSGSAINRSGSTVDNLLKAVEMGGDLYYEWIYADNTVVQGYKGTESKDLYSMYYANWIGSSSEFYSRIKNEIGAVAGKEITSHYQYEKDVFITEYEGIKVAVNYRNDSVSVNGTEIPAKDFRVLGGEA